LIIVDCPLKWDSHCRHDIPHTNSLVQLKPLTSGVPCREPWMIGICGLCPRVAGCHSVPEDRIQYTYRCCRLMQRPLRVPSGENIRREEKTSVPGASKRVGPLHCRQTHGPVFFSRHASGAVTLIPELGYAVVSGNATYNMPIVLARGSGGLDGVLQYILASHTRTRCSLLIQRRSAVHI